MNIATRKLAMLEKIYKEQEEAQRIQGYTTNCIDNDMRNRVVNLMNRIRTL